MTLHGALLAGGGSRRFGTPKAFAEYRGRPLVAWVADRLREVCDETFVVGAYGGRDHERLAQAAGLPVVPDLRHDAGPLAGIETALDRARRNGGTGALVLGCDAPLVSPELLRAVLGAGEVSRVVRAGGRVHPLTGFYRVELLDAVSARLDEGAGSVRDLVSAEGIEVLDADELLGAERAARELSNVNTVDDLQRLDAR